jgi:uncharacterized protein
LEKQEKLTGADYFLLLLYLDDKKPIRSAVRLTKMMFLFKEEIAPLLKKKGAEINEDTLPNFQPYNYGPFSKDIYEQVELFKNIEFIKVQNLNVSEEMDEVDDWEEKAFIDELAEQSTGYENKRDGKFMQYELLKRGIDYVCSEIEPRFTEDQIKILLEFKNRINQTPIKAILRYVYTKYPEMTENSLIKDEVLRN